MKNRIIMLSLGVMFSVSILVSGVVLANSGGDRLPWMNEDGIGDMSQYPMVQSVVNRTGEVVGTVGTIETKYLGTSKRIPVTGTDGRIVGHFGPDGFWALGEPESSIEGKVHDY